MKSSDKTKRWHACFFDFDGTLFDSAPDITRCVNLIGAKLGRQPLDIADVRPLIGRGLGDLLSGAFPGLSSESLGLSRAQFVEAYQRSLYRLSRPFPGADLVVESLAGKCGLVTNKPRRFVDPLLAHLHWNFRVVVAGDDGLQRKPSGEGLTYAAHAMGLSPADCIYVGDDPVDEAAAHAAGMSYASVAWGRTASELHLDRLTDVLQWVKHDAQSAVLTQGEQ